MSSAAFLRTPERTSRPISGPRGAPEPDRPRRIRRNPGLTEAAGSEELEDGLHSLSQIQREEREEFLRGFDEACDVPLYDPDEDDLQELPWRRPWDWLQGAFVLEGGDPTPREAGAAWFREIRALLQAGVRA